MRVGRLAVAMELKDISNHVAPHGRLDIDLGIGSEICDGGIRIGRVAHVDMVHAIQRCDHLRPVMRGEWRRPGFRFAVHQYQQRPIGGLCFQQNAAHVGRQHVEPPAGDMEPPSASRWHGLSNDFRTGVQGLFPYNTARRRTRSSGGHSLAGASEERCSNASVACIGRYS